MNKQIKTIGAFIIASAIVWATVIIGSSYALQGTGCYEKIQTILVGGMFFHIILIWGPLALLFKKKSN